MAKHVTLIDAGTGNIRSVHKALESLGASVRLTDDPRQLLRSSRVILPGVGAFGEFMKRLQARGLQGAIQEFFQRGFPLLGICVGMQALFEASEEMGEHPGLGLLPGRVLRFPSIPDLKIPHTGWNELNPEKDSPLWQNLSPGDYAYFNHAYYCAAARPGNIVASTHYGILFTSAVQHENLFGVQFHPEKSQRVGLKILANFLNI